MFRLVVWREVEDVEVEQRKCSDLAVEEDLACRKAACREPGANRKRGSSHDHAIWEVDGGGKYIGAVAGVASRGKLEYQGVRAFWAVSP
jgi:hypothetical protein